MLIEQGQIYGAGNGKEHFLDWVADSMARDICKAKEDGFNDVCRVLAGIDGTDLWKDLRETVDCKASILDPGLPGKHGLIILRDTMAYIHGLKLQGGDRLSKWMKLLDGLDDCMVYGNDLTLVQNLKAYYQNPAAYEKG